MPRVTSKNSGLYSTHSIGSNSQFDRLRVKITTTFSASGLSAPFFIWAFSLGANELLVSNKELDKTSRVVAWKIEGFSTHSSTNLLSQSCSCLTLMRRSKNELHPVDAAKFDFCSNEVLRLFTKGIKMKIA